MVERERLIFVFSVKQEKIMSDLKLRIGDVSDNGQVTIVDEDRLCYQV